MSAPDASLVKRGIEATRLLVHRAGFDVQRERFKRHFVGALVQHGITDVLDIGANTGQFAEAVRRAGMRGRIVSVEPLAQAFGELERRKDRDAAWTVERAAVSAEPGRIEMHVSANSVSSSVLPILDRHVAAAPESRYVATEEVTATTVDELVERHRLNPATTLLKIDVQGYEGAVLDGATATLGRFGAVRTELSLVPLYDGQALLADLVTRLAGVGLDLWLVEPGFTEPGTHRLLQLDGTFFRAEPT